MNKILLRDYNHPYLISWLANPADATDPNIGSQTAVRWRCPDCQYVHVARPCNIKRQLYFPCPICSDGVSYPEKIMGEVLRFLKIDFEREKHFEWAVIQHQGKQCRCLYDFCFQQYLIETDGSYHIIPRDKTIKAKKRNQYIDQEKTRLANLNGYQLIRIDCTTSDPHFLRNSITIALADILPDIYLVDWSVIYKRASSSRVIECCKMYNQGIPSIEIRKYFQIAKGTLIRYLKRGTLAGLCKYNPKDFSAKAFGVKKRDEIYKLFKQGLNSYEIAQQVALTQPIVRKYLRELRRTKQIGKNPYIKRNDRHEQILALLQSGQHTQSEIGRILGVSEQVVYWHKKKAIAEGNF